MKIKEKLKKHYKKIIIFFVIIALLAAAYPFAKVTGVFYDRPDKYLSQFYLEPENSLDGVVVGSSAAYRYWIPTDAFERSGMAVYNYGSTGTPFFTYKNIVKDILETQNPKFIIIEIRSLARKLENMNMGYAKSLISYMPPSKNRTAIIRDFVKTDKIYDTEASSNMLKYGFPEYKADDDTILPVVNLKNKFKGFKRYNGDVSAVVKKVNKSGKTIISPREENLYVETSYKWPGFTNKKQPLCYNYEEVLVDFLDYCDTIDCKVLFLETPCRMSQARQEMLNTGIEIIKKRGYEVLNMNTEKMVSEIGLDFEKDFINDRHTNCAGAVKVTRYLTGYLKKKYKTPDHRGDSKYQSWVDSQETLKKDIDSTNKEAAEKAAENTD